MRRKIFSPQTQVADHWNYHHTSPLLLNTDTTVTMGKKIVEEVDPTGWMLSSDIANFVLLHQKEVLYMCMVSLCVSYVAITLQISLTLLFLFIFISMIAWIHILTR